MPARGSAKAQAALGIVSLVFSCLFMLELVASIWAFGVRYVGMCEACGIVIVADMDV